MGKPRPGTSSVACEIKTPPDAHLQARSRMTDFGSLSSRIPLNDAWRNCPLLVHPGSALGEVLSDVETVRLNAPWQVFPTLSFGRWHVQCRNDMTKASRDNCLASNGLWQIEYIHRQFPGKSHDEVVSALESAKRELNGSEDRHKIAKLMRQMLG
jgi:hypothetical protein